MSNVNAKGVLKPAIILLLICGVAAGLLGVVASVTAGPIAYQNELATTNALAEVLPEGKSFDPIEMTDDLKTGTVASAYDAKNDAGETIGYVVEVTPSGFGGTIDIMVGVDLEGKVTGISILSMSESPGLGANASQESFRSQFVGLSAPIAVTKDGGTIVALTSATITSRAVSNGVTDACNWATSYNGAAN